MPRQIIDTESSLPAYQRRRTRTFVAAFIVVALALAGAAWLYWAVLPGKFGH